MFNFRKSIKESRHNTASRITSKIQKIKKAQKLFESTLNESMVFPRSVRRIWWDGNESFLVLGENNRWYNVYPNYGDAYLVDCELDKLFDSYVEKILLAYNNNGIRPLVFTYNWGDTAQIVDETNSPKFLKQLTVWLQKRGFELIEEPSESNWGKAVWEYTGEYGDDSKNPEKLAAAKKMIDVTDEVEHCFTGFNGPKHETLQALKYLQKYHNKNRNVNNDDFDEDYDYGPLG